MNQLLQSILAMILSGVLLSSSAHPFDTGHHSDVTRSALVREGFNGTATNVVILQNWIADYYGNFPIFLGSLPDPEIAVFKKELEKLHFDNLFNSQEVRSYWWRLVANTRFAVQREARKNKPDPTALLTILGTSIHAVQDFYSHSNWVEIFGANSGPFERKTWFDVEKTGEIPPNLHTGWYKNEMFNTQPTGSQSHEELNKDHYKRCTPEDPSVRCNWAQAYVFAYAASRQWARSVREWVEEIKPGLWDREVKGYIACGSDADALYRDLDISYGIQSWIPSPVLQGGGHWKGPGSGNLLFFNEEMKQWRTKPYSRFKLEFTDKLRFAELSTELYSSRIPPQLPVIRPITISERAVVLRTIETFDIRGNASDMLAKIAFTETGPGGFAQEYIEATQQNNRGSANWPWWTISFVPQNITKVDIRYGLYNEELLEDEKMDILNIADKTDLNFSFFISGSPSHNCTGDITGVHDTKDTAVTTQGDGIDKRPARIRFFITEIPLR